MSAFGGKADMAFARTCLLLTQSGHRRFPVWRGKRKIAAIGARSKAIQKIIKRAARIGATLSTGWSSGAILVDDLHHTSSAGLNQNRMLVHVGVSVTRHMVLSRHLIIRDSLLGQDRTNAKFLLVAI